MPSFNIMSMRWLLALGNTGLFGLLVVGGYSFFLGPKEELKVDLPDPAEVLVHVPKTSVNPRIINTVRSIFDYTPPVPKVKKPKVPVIKPTTVRVDGPLKAFEIASMLKSGEVAMVVLSEKQEESKSSGRSTARSSRSSRRKSSRKSSRRRTPKKKVANCYVGDVFEDCEITKINTSEQFIEYSSRGTTYTLRKERAGVAGYNPEEGSIGGVVPTEDQENSRNNKRAAAEVPAAEKGTIRKAGNASSKSNKKPTGSSKAASNARTKAAAAKRNSNSNSRKKYSQAEVDKLNKLKGNKKLSPKDRKDLEKTLDKLQKGKK